MLELISQSKIPYSIKNPLNRYFEIFFTILDKLIDDAEYFEEFVIIMWLFSMILEGGIRKYSWIILISSRSNISKVLGKGSNRGRIGLYSSLDKLHLKS